ncbi:MAG: DNA-directed RNA polymerase subunit beta [Chloroflexota bacterium]|nr:DNA-directed RNA polymerase subunit beta [Chloroflexota bacterium]
MAFVLPSQKIPRKSYARLPQILKVPNLIEVQLGSFQWFQANGLRQLLEEISNKKDETGATQGIRDFTGSKLELTFVDYEFRAPRHTEAECRQRGLTYSAPLYVRAKLLVKGTGEIKEEDLFFGDLPLMTAKGTFIISGAERVVVSQLLRSPGVYFIVEEDPSSGRPLCRAKLIPDRGAWLEFETSNRNVISAKIDGKRKIPITTLLRAIGYSDDEQLLSLFPNEDNVAELSFIRTTMEREPSIKNEADALIDIYRKLRPNDPPNLENAKRLVNNLFFNSLHYDLGRVGRYKLNKRLEIKVPEAHRALTKEDIVEIIRHIILIDNGRDHADDIDHLGNRRVRTVGELIQNQFRIGLLRLERVAMERMSIIPVEGVVPSALVNIRPVVAAITEFFNSSQLSQFMDQTNPLAELTHKRRLSAMGPGGLSRERAGFDVRDVHYTHYGRICPIETPEGPNIGLIGSLATYGVVNHYGFIETPYRRVVKEVSNTDAGLLGKTTREVVKWGKTVIEAKTTLTPEHVARLRKLAARMIPVVPVVSNEVEYLTADREDIYTIAQANARLDENGQFVEEKVEARLADRYVREAPEKIDYMDVAPKQLFSVATSLIPFLEHDDANRALMGANMQRQSVPLLCPEAPIVATGVEMEAAKDGGQVLFARNAGIVSSVTGYVENGQNKGKIEITTDAGKTDTYELLKFVRTNQGTCVNHHPVVSRGDRVEAGQVIADGSATEMGELALGQNVLCAFMSWEGYNYEDAIIISSRLVREDKFASIHIEKYENEARDTKLGPEEITRDIPNVGEESLRELDETGIVRVGAEVTPGDILVGKITPKGETELSAEEKLLRAIFGEKAREVKDTSLRVPHGEWGKVIDVRVFSREAGDDLPAGVNQRVQVWVAQRRRVSVGDKLAGRHGNKGVIGLIAPVEDMPFLPDGTPIDIILNPIGVPSRMNLGQVLEAHIGWAAQTLGFKVLTPVFDGADDYNIEAELARAWIAQKAGAVNIHPGNGNGSSAIRMDVVKAWLKERGYDANRVFSDEHVKEAREVCLRLWLEEFGVDSRELSLQELEQTVEKVSVERNEAPPIHGKVTLRDGRSGEPFDQPVTVGNVYMMKLIHLVEDKVHARSTGPYSLISQQPLGGKAQFGGQRFGEMEVWTLEAYGAARNLQEILTIKSDDVAGRAKTYEAIIKGEDIVQAGVPESFKVLVKELQSLGLAVEVISEQEKPAPAEAMEEVPKLAAEVGLGPVEGLAAEEKTAEAAEVTEAGNTTDETKVPEEKIAEAAELTEAGEITGVAEEAKVTESAEVPESVVEDVDKGEKGENA